MNNKKDFTDDNIKERCKTILLFDYRFCIKEPFRYEKICFEEYLKDFETCCSISKKILKDKEN